MNTVAVIQARMQSTRLPKKVLMDLGGKPVLEWVITAALNAPGIERVVVATSIESADDVIEDFCRNYAGIQCIRGSENDVVSRFVVAATLTNADTLIRLTADCPLLDYNVIGQVVKLQSMTGADYASCIYPPTFPDGLDTECFTVDALKIADREAISKIDRECTTTFLYHNQHRFRCENLVCPLPGLHKERWVLDCEDDLRFCREVVDRLSGRTPTYVEILDILDANPELRKINAHHPRNERYYEALANEPLPRRSYATSKQLLERAEKTIPLAAQTYSKSKIQYPADSPLFVTHGDGAYCFDVDGNRYVDLVGGLLPVILGHRDPDVDRAIRSQLDRGISFSLSTELEAELSELLCRLIPCAEMVRLGKNGTDITSAAVRLARAYTGRDLVLSSGYHGWADWSVAQDKMRWNGVTDAGRRDTYALRHGERDLEKWIGKNVACIIIEPETDPEWLGYLRGLCDERGIVLIFDEIITWPRWGLSGAQGAYNVTPDLTCVSKAMANGMPIGALVGRRKIMQYMEKISYSGTFFGETLSIAAALATITKIEAEGIIEQLAYTKDVIAGRLQGLFDKHRIGGNIMFDSKNPLLRLYFAGQDIKTLFIQEMAQNGVLIIASHNLSAAHGPNEIKRILTAYDATLGVIREALDKGDIQQRIQGRAIPAYANVRAAS